MRFVGMLSSGLPLGLRERSVPFRKRESRVARFRRAGARLMKVRVPRYWWIPEAASSMYRSYW